MHARHSDLFSLCYPADFASQFGRVIFARSAVAAADVNISGNAKDDGNFLEYHEVGNGTISGSLPSLRQACGEGAIAYIPAKDWNSGVFGVRLDVLTFTLEDSGGLWTSISIGVKVSPVNDAPLLEYMVSYDLDDHLVYFQTNFIAEDFEREC